MRRRSIFLEFAEVANHVWMRCLKQQVPQRCPDNAAMARQLANSKPARKIARLIRMAKELE